MSFDFSTLITDRSQSDVETARELTTRVENGLATAEEIARWNLAAEKGAYNYTDLNRVIAAMDDINERLKAAGYVTGYRRIEVPRQGGGGLPEGYKELEYIQSSGTQYIDTGFTPNQETKAELDFQMIGNGGIWQCVFGERQPSANIDSFAFWLDPSNNFLFYWSNTNSGFPEPLNFAGRHTLTIDGNISSMDGQTISQPSSTFTGKYPIAIFAINEGALSSFANFKLYGLKLYNDGLLVRNYRPCRSPDGDVGLYDLVSEQFYGNSGTGSFIAGPMADLPSEYTELEYIQTSGTQYINLDFNPNQDTSIEVKFQTNQTNMAGVCMSGATWGDRMFGIFSHIAVYANNSTSAIFYGNEPVIAKLDKNSVYKDDSLINTFQYSQFQVLYPLYLMARNYGNSVGENTPGLYYYCIVEDNSIMVRKMIPVKRNLDNVIGMYDMMNGVFYTNSGYGDFTAGPEVENNSAIMTASNSELDPYIWYEDDVPTYSLMQGYLSNVKALRSTLEVIETTPEVPDDMDALTFTEANNIELILIGIEAVINSMSKVFIRSGTTVSGGPGFYFVN